MAATTLSPISPVERRRFARFQPAYGTICRISPGATGVGLVCDLSVTGVMMLLSRPVEVGAVVKAELTAESGGPGVPVVVRVVRVHPTQTGDYIVGGEFETPIAVSELKAFVNPSRSTRRPKPHTKTTRPNPAKKAIRFSK